MRKIISIGESCLEVLFRGEVPVKSYPGGELLNASACMGSDGVTVDYVSEVARDRVGDIVSGFLESHGVNVRSIDRYTEGTTPVNLLFMHDDGSVDTVRYGRYPDSSFDVVWPRIDPDDIVIFGGYYSLDPRVRTRLFDIVKYAAERKAVIVYMPGFERDRAPRITRVMPSILENFEVASLVVTFDGDMPAIFNEDDAAAYRNHISFYCNNCINIDSKAGAIRFYNRQLTQSVESAPAANSLEWRAAALAGVIEGLIDGNVMTADMDAIDYETMLRIVESGVKRASNS